MLVEPGVNTDIFGSHLFNGELLDFLDGTGSTVFETDSMQPFVEVNGVFAGDNLAHGGSLLFLRHFDCSEKGIQIYIIWSVDHDFIEGFSFVGSGKTYSSFLPFKGSERLIINIIGYLLLQILELSLILIKFWKF